jgi:hypothetical protein
MLTRQRIRHMHLTHGFLLRDDPAPFVITVTPQ